MPYFHFQPNELASGAVIEPGNFGRLLRTHEALPDFNLGRVFVTALLCREMLWESMRLERWPKLPSRQKCVFIFPTREDADAYAVENNRDGRQILHEVELVDPNCAQHTGFISHCTTQSGGSFLDQMIPKGEAYWNGVEGDAAKGREMLIAGTVKVIRKAI